MAYGHIGYSATLPLQDLQCHSTQDIRNLPCVLSVKDFVALTFPDGELVQVRFGKKMYMGVSKNGVPFFPQKWMVYCNGKPYEQMDDLGVALFLEIPI